LRTFITQVVHGDLPPFAFADGDPPLEIDLIGRCSHRCDGSRLGTFFVSAAR